MTGDFLYIIPLITRLLVKTKKISSHGVSFLEVDIDSFFYVEKSRAITPYICTLKTHICTRYLARHVINIYIPGSLDCNHRKIIILFNTKMRNSPIWFDLFLCCVNLSRGGRFLPAVGVSWQKKNRETSGLVSVSKEAELYFTVFYPQDPLEWGNDEGMREWCTTIQNMTGFLTIQSLMQMDEMFL